MRCTRNVLTHIVCVPVIEFSSIGLGLVVSDKMGGARGLLAPNIGTAYISAIVPYYVLLDRPSGLLRGLLVVAQVCYLLLLCHQWS